MQTEQVKLQTINVDAVAGLLSKLNNPLVSLIQYIVAHTCDEHASYHSPKAQQQILGQQTTLQSQGLQ